MKIIFLVFKYCFMTSSTATSSIAFHLPPSFIPPTAKNIAPQTDSCEIALAAPIDQTQNSKELLTNLKMWIKLENVENVD
jgi:hypothetical protein